MLITLLRTVILYFVVIICMRIMGKRQVGELQPSELVVAILISELALIPMQDLNRPITNGIIAIFTLVVLELVISVLSVKSRCVRRLFAGKSAIIIENGNIDIAALKKLRLTVEDLQEQLRQNGNFKIEEVDYAILETNGKLSVLAKQNALPVTKGDMNINNDNSGMPMAVIIDGKYQNDCIKKQNFSKKLIDKKLNENKLSVDEVFLMTLNSKNEAFIIRKDLKQ